MTDTDTSTPVENVSTVGSMLAAERLRQGLSVGDTAQNLKLGIRQVEALEADDYEKLPGRTFVRGFVRNYARLLQLDPVPLLAMIETAEPPKQLHARALSGRTLLPSYNRKNNKRRYAIGIVLIALIAASIFGWYYYNSPNALETTVAAAPSLPAPSLPVQPDLGNIPASVAPSSPVSVPGKPATLVPPEKPLSTTETTNGELKFSFARDSWVQVKDKRGKVLFSQLNPAGSEQVIKGKAPFSLIVGNAAYAKLTYNGKPVDLNPHIQVEVARLTLE